jgi:hypothetical protein
VKAAILPGESARGYQRPCISMGMPNSGNSLTPQAQLMLIALAQGKLLGETVLTFSLKKLPEQLLALKYRSFSGKVVIEIVTNKEV